MTRAEAIEIFKLLRQQDTRVEADDYEQAIDMAISALEQQPTVCDIEYGCKYCKNNGDTCLECEYDGITRGYTRFEPIEKNVIEQISDEIEQEYNRFRNMSDMWDERANGLGTALEIIDKYR